jgi:hypothetical protein
MAKSCLPITYSYLTYRLFPKLGSHSHSLYLHIHLGLRLHMHHWFIRVKHLGAADEVPRVAEALDF